MSAFFSTSKALSVMSPKFPIGVGTSTSLGI
jgi:hypothetical protein